MCHVSHVTCHVSCVTCHMSHVIFFFFYVKKIGQSGGASRWRVCYQRGLPRLVSKYLVGLTIVIFSDISQISWQSWAQSSTANIPNQTFFLVLVFLGRIHCDFTGFTFKMPVTCTEANKICFITKGKWLKHMFWFLFIPSCNISTCRTRLT